MYQRICFYEEGYCVRNLSSEQDFLQAYRLRHQVFCNTLGWVESHADGLERDDYDAWSLSFGVFNEHNLLLGTFRILTHEYPFMLEREFRELLAPDYRLNKSAETIEVTRLTTVAIREGYHAHTRQVSALLYKGLYQWVGENAVRYLYFVVESRYLRGLRMAGFPCEPLSPAKPLRGGVESVAVLLDAARFHAKQGLRHHAQLTWLATYRSSPAAMPEPRHANAWTRPVLPSDFEYETSRSVR